MYALESPNTSHLSSDNSSNHHIEQMASNLYNLDSATMSSYSHPASHSPYNNSAAHSLLLPSSVNYHHLELNPVSTEAAHTLEATESHTRVSASSA